MKQKGKEWIDAQGIVAPVYAVNPVLKVEEKEAQKLATLALRAEKALNDFVEASDKAYENVLSAKIKMAEFKGNKVPSGSITINSYDYTEEIKITMPYNLYFDNTYTEMIKAKFDEFFNSLQANSEMAVFMKRIVQDLMFTSGGKLDYGKVLQLRKFKDDIECSPQMRKKGQPFIDAVNLFDKAIKKKPGNRGIYVQHTENPGEKKRRVNLKYSDF